MEKKFKYQFDATTGVLYKYYYGLICIDDIESSWEYAFENNLIPRETKGIILDYRNSNFNIAHEASIEIVNFYRKHIDVFLNLKIAIVTVSPKDIVIPILVQAHDKGYRSSPFSTIESALNWILNE